MAKRPGGEMASRPLHFTWIVDGSGSMSVDRKMESLNTSIRETLPHMQRVADENPNVHVLISALRFSQGTSWHVGTPTSIATFKWEDVAADSLSRGSCDLDIVFLVDTSGSMGDEIEGVKASCVEFADHIQKAGAGVRLGLVGFDIGGHRGSEDKSYGVHQLGTYTIGVWPLADPASFKLNVQTLTLCLFGGWGCFLANPDTVDIFPHVVAAFDGPKERKRILVIVTDEIGGATGVTEIVAQLRQAEITTHVLGVPGQSGAHETIAKLTGGHFWNIFDSKGGRLDFTTLLSTVAETIAHEMTSTLADGTISQGTDMGAAMRAVAARLCIPPMVERAHPPVLVLISDGQPTDDFKAGLAELLALPWGRKSVRIAIGIGEDADQKCLQEFIGNPNIKPLQANSPDALLAFIQWASTSVLKSVSSPVTQTVAGADRATGQTLQAAPDVSEINVMDVW